MIKHQISKVQKNSIAAEMGIAGGDFLLSINGEEVRDILDYRFRIAEEYLLVEIEKASHISTGDSQSPVEIWELDIEKDPDEDLGLIFKQSLMSHKKRCRNKCIFCFVDQQPKGLRPSLYIKDDDPRMSFLLGNYVTLTNLSHTEVKRLAGYHLSPLRISVHAANLDIRAKMMGTDAARNLFDTLDVFAAAGIEMHFQIVLCKGINDGVQLDYTIEKLRPYGKSLAVVPAGLTRHREGLFQLKAFSKQDARDVICQMERIGCNYDNPSASAHKTFAFLSDEWYILAGLPLPPYKHYENFPQLDNGVGMLRLFEREFLRGMLQDCPRKDKLSCFVRQRGRRSQATPTNATHSTANAPLVKIRNFLTQLRSQPNPTNIAIVTGTAAADFMRSIASKFTQVHPHTSLIIHPVQNHFLGKSVTVSGLLSGQDIVRCLKGKLQNTTALFLPENAFRAGVSQKIMLDSTTLKQLEKSLGVRIIVGSTNGRKFYRQLADTIR